MKFYLFLALFFILACTRALMVTSAIKPLPLEVSHENLVFQIDTVYKYKALVKILNGRERLGGTRAFWYFKNKGDDLHLGDIVEGRFKIEPLNLLSNFGDYFDEAYYFKKGIFWKLKGEGFFKKEHRHDFFESLRLKVLKALKKHPSEPYLKILLLGEPQKEEGFQTIRNLGISHLFVISGLHLGVIFFFFYFLLLGVFSYHHQKACLLVSFLICLFYTKLCYPHICLERAFLMIFCFCINEFLGRKSSSFSILIFVSSVLLLKNPSVLWDLSFQLSFVALLFLGLAQTGKSIRIHERVGACFFSHVQEKKNTPDSEPRLLVKSLDSGILKLVLTCFYIYVGTAPLILFYFHHISLAGFFLNILLIPFFSAFLIPVLFLTLVLILLQFSFLYSPLLFFLDFIFQKMVFLFERAPTLPFSFAIQDLFSLLLIYLLLFFLMNHSFKRVRVSCIAFLLLVFLFKIVLNHNQNELQITFLDVGHGDALFVQFPQGTTMLVDAGTHFKNIDMGRRVVVPFLQWKGVRKLDTLVITHADLDHSGGVQAVLEKIGVGEVWLNSLDFEDPNLGSLLKTLQEKKISYKVQAQREEVLDIEGALLQFLWPYQNCQGFNRNQCSLVFTLQFGNTQFLLTGDVEAQGERFLNFSHFKNLKHRILKVAHHGSHTSTSQRFLESFKPDVSVISCGFRKPNKGVLERLNKINAQVLRTDVSGAVLIRTDGKEIKIKEKS